MNKTLKIGLTGFILLNSLSAPNLLLPEIPQVLVNNLEELARNRELAAAAESLGDAAELLDQLYEEPLVQSAFLPDLIEQEARVWGLDSILVRQIAFCESRFRQYDSKGKPIRGLHNTDDVGLFQINEKFHLSKSRELGFDIYTTRGNLEYALWLLKSEGAHHWQWSRKCWTQ